LPIGRGFTFEQAKFGVCYGAGRGSIGDFLLMVNPSIFLTGLQDRADRRDEERLDE
jgi:hypothetical protein